MDKKDYIKSIKRSSSMGLWVSVAVVIVTSVLLLLHLSLNLSEDQARWMLVAGTVLTVLTVSMTLLTVRRRIPQLRQCEKLEDKLEGYANHVRSIYSTLTAVVAVLCCAVILSGNSVLLMLAMVTALLLFLNFPNIYRIKVDLGLNDEEMEEIKK